MKRITLILVFSAFFIYSFSQNRNYKITYKQCVQYDTLKTLIDTIGFQAVLTGNDRESNYVYFKHSTSTNMVKPTLSPGTIANAIDQKKSGTYTYKVGSETDEFGSMLFYDKLADSTFIREKSEREYIIATEKTPVINWQIGKEEKQIKNYRCIKATCYFRGRNYTVWFTPDIAIAEGPWKFKGLPGLIMELEDDKHQVKIYVSEMEYPTKDIVPQFTTLGKMVTVMDCILYRNNDKMRRAQAVQTLLNGQENVEKFGVKPTVTSKNGSAFGIEKKLN